ncbi:MAG: EAL domain-containing protein, partial [gamma proteobacterium symbiont of Bathyaustriella thionipta]|nr:EAL domain-containing protein [gamma proteobacterium symbiont of Bathyaustriella thionipta]MCU7951244.1 EAL domain-containing protein [gamma proteobacterium symbiont of Bathyaustriella thionipta]MCU7953399.1 EAL domain-containing protein [gamma proteobacterium symbiont of Bathyaustriella thionipta]MCU7957770.1 EAL domain-containing protein [gamma proteobacterium symbiont of Bathyaustriella thionipta]MCU7966141.1 EAL domain-containing protein [gamma proteobacterium symbiont of Bathyaustriella
FQYLADNFSRKHFFLILSCCFIYHKKICTRIKDSFYGKTDKQLLNASNVNSEFITSNFRLEAKAWKKKKVIKKLKTIINPDGKAIEFNMSISPIFDCNNKASRLIISGQLIHQSIGEKNRLLLMDSLFYNSHLSFIILDEKLHFMNINKAFSDMTGFSESDITGKSFSILNASKKHNLVSKILLSFKDENFDLWDGEILCANKKGEIILAKLEITRIINQHNLTTNFFASLIDITKQRKNERHIMQIAHYDALTGLSNRVMFLERLSQSISESKRNDKHAILFFIDLDKFKAVNDSLGHDAGDEVLKETARRLLSVTRKEDVVSRFSGDEFSILLSSEDSHEYALYIASMIAKKIIKEISRAYYFQTREIFIGSSIGITIYPEDGNTSELLLKNSDIAMYQAKNRGRNNYQFYKSEYSSAINDRLSLENKLRKAISKDELRLYYQPQYSLKNRQIMGAEVLIRWFIDDNGIQKMIPPDYFIPIAEDSGLIIEIGEWIIINACKQIKTWIDEGLTITQISVNISARQFLDNGFMNSISEALHQAKLAPEHLELEITESMLIGDTKRIELQLSRLKKMGIKIALDDFGTGYSSLSYLKNFPIDVLKIDQSFVKEMTEESKDAKIARAIIEMGHSLGQKIVAEGVETEDQLIYLSQHHCDIIQGYYFSKPLPAHKMNSFLKIESN